MSENITPVILCGGSGTRLWPLSRRNFPKQFVPLVDGQSLLDLTFGRVQEFGTPPLVVCGEEHRFLVVDTMQRAEVSGDVILESVSRNTAPAMALAALHVEQDDGLLLFCPADHHIPDAAAFVQVVRSGVLAAQNGAIVIFSIQPSHPATGYGYIEQGESLGMGDARAVKRFIEKPDRQTAEHLLLDSCVFWNAGIFLCRRDVLLEALAQHAPDILDTCRAALEGAQQALPVGNVRLVRPDPRIFEDCRSKSIDQAVIEKHYQVAVVPFNGRWSDVGSWNVVAELTSPDPDGNRIEGQGIAHRARGTYIQAPSRTVVALGTQDLLIIDTADVVLVANRSYAEEVKEVVAMLDEFRRAETITHRKVARPWGWYDSIDLGERFQVKKINVKPGSALSLQMHHHRAEHWIVVRGTAEVTRGQDTFLLTENQSTYIPLGESHRLRNPGKVELELIEVQSGSYLGEDDIVRFEDTYGRAHLAGTESRIV